jgi:hypothetical protein
MMLNFWHGLLDMPKHDEEWHQADIRRELAELRAAGSSWQEKWSEYADVAYVHSRARWAGFDLALPIPRHVFYLSLIYMLPKYTLRYLFFRRAGLRCGKRIYEVRNPKKPEKLRSIAKHNGINPDEFVAVCQEQLRYWPLIN